MRDIGKGNGATVIQLDEKQRHVAQFCGRFDMEDDLVMTLTEGLNLNADAHLDLGCAIKFGKGMGCPGRFKG